MKKRFVQFISNDTRESDKFKGNDFKISHIENPDSLDMFEINIIDLRNKKIWQCKGNNFLTIDMQKDFENLAIMIQKSICTKIIIIFPQDLSFVYNYRYEKFTNHVKLKNMLNELTNTILNIYLKLPRLNLCYEHTETQIKNSKIGADFYFDKSDNVVTKSNFSNKSTTIKCNQFLFTTLNILSMEELVNFIENATILENNDDEPEWMKKILKFDDLIQINKIDENNNKINELQESTRKAEEVLLANRKKKSILYTNGDQLIEASFDILGELFDYDMSQFQDKKIEDFIIELDEVIFIGEIKGVSSNVKNMHISQLELHYQDYLDRIEGNEVNKLIKPILLICHQRNKELENREPIHEKQILLAERNEALIIETHVLLDIYEKFRLKKLNRKEILEYLTNNKGIAKVI